MSGNLTLFGWKGDLTDLESRVTALEHGTTYNNPTTTKGDLITRSTTDVTRLGVGTNDQALIADSTQTSGMKWASYDHVNLTNKGTNTHAQIDSHISASSGVHGVVGSVLGTSDIQTVSNKTINSSDNAIQVSGTPIDSYIDQDVRVNSNPSFQSVEIDVLAGPIVTNTLNSFGFTVVGKNPPNDSTQLRASPSGGNFIVTVPNITDTLVTRTNTENLSNKTFTNTTHVGTAATDRTSISTSSVSITNSTGQAIISLAGGEATAGTSIRGSSGALHLYTSNASSPTLRMSIPNTGIANDNSITNILGLNGTNLVYKNNIVDTSTSQSLTNKTLDSITCGFTRATGRQILFDLTNAIDSTSTTFKCQQNANRIITFPDATTTLVGQNTTDTLTSKTLTLPIISQISNTGTLTLPTSTDTLVGRATTDALTNKSSIGIGVATANGDLQFPAATKNRKIVLYEVTNNDNQYYGFGVNPSTLRYQVENTSSDHVFYASTSSSASNELMRVKGTGGLQLPTSGGTPSNLNYYEEGTFSVTWTGAISSSSTARFIRIGNVVTISLQDKTSAAIAANAIQGAVQLPSRLRPTNWGPFWPIFVIDNSVTLTTPGKVQFNNNGDINIWKDSTGASFTNSGNAGFISFTVSYNIN